MLILLFINTHFLALFSYPNLIGRCVFRWWFRWRYRLRFSSCKVILVYLLTFIYVLMYIFCDVLIKGDGKGSRSVDQSEKRDGAFNGDSGGSV